MFTKYLNRDTVTVSRSENKLQSVPALTFCIKNNFKNLSGGSLNSGFSVACNSSSIEELDLCFDRYTYNHTETVQNVLLGSTKPVSFLNSKYWTSKFQAKQMGRCHTLQIPELLSGNAVENNIIVSLNAQTDLLYVTLIHDPNYFLIASNPLTYSRIQLVHSKLLTTNKNGTGETFFLSVHHHKYLEHDADGNKKCDPDPTFDYMTCIQKYGARSVGCHPRWDNIFGNYPNCSTMDQIRQHEELYKLYYNEDKNTIQEKTGCLMPCDYYEYRLVDERQIFTHKDPNSFKISINLVSKTNEKLDEELMYPFISFMGEFGGSLGLFLGASFFSIWDFVEYSAFKLKIAGHPSTKPDNA